ncbi:MAG TPA: aminotransferase class V-fold PLP-dependent enzyme [Blastocatellia bacterium]|nr:aminotransferase class V-fold PLP-dependent enzyme [Blastocatellia bacterium]
MNATAALDGFGDFAGRIWLNTAHQGPLPLASAREAHEAIAWKLAPHELTAERFDGIPRRLRTALGKVVNVPPDEIVLGNSASYGLHVVATGYSWQAGDEILVMAGDFPSDLLPWLMIEQRCGTRVVRIKPRDHVIAPDELEAAITPRTRLFCTTWVHSFSGFGIDLDALGAICRARGVVFVLNASQALGARQIDLARVPVDAITCAGWKWLCGPYGTGFSWIAPQLRQQLRRVKAYWLSLRTAEDLGKEIVDPELPDALGPRSFDIFAPANFFNYKPWAASVEFLLEKGLERIRDHDDALVDSFIAGLDSGRFEVLSPREKGPRRSTLVFFSHRDRERNHHVHSALARAGIDIALRGGLLRVSAHLHNSTRDIARALDVLNDFQRGS